MVFAGPDLRELKRFRKLDPRDCNLLVSAGSAVLACWSGLEAYGSSSSSNAGVIGVTDSTWVLGTVTGLIVVILGTVGGVDFVDDIFSTGEASILSTRAGRATALGVGATSVLSGMGLSVTSRTGLESLTAE